MQLSGHAVRERFAVVPLLGLVLAACGSGSSCATSPVPASCPDLVVQGQPYVVWREIPAPHRFQEVSDGTYPACNVSDRCGGDPLDGHGSTDVWKYDGVAPARAVIGLLENSDSYAVLRPARGRHVRAAAALIRDTPGVPDRA